MNNKITRPKHVLKQDLFLFLWSSRFQLATEQEKVAISATAWSTQLPFMLQRAPVLAGKGAHTCSANSSHRSSLILQCGLKSLQVEEKMDPDLLWPLCNNQQRLLFLSWFCEPISNHILFCCLFCTQQILPGFIKL